MPANKKYQKLEFSTQEDDLLIEKVKENPLLYSKILKSYKDMRMKDRTWAKIAKELGNNRTGEECKKRWTNLRDYCLKKRKKLGAGSTASRCRGEKLEKMSFLEHKETTSNVSSVVNNEQIINSEMICKTEPCDTESEDNINDTDEVDGDAANEPESTTQTFDYNENNPWLELNTNECNNGEKSLTQMFRAVEEDGKERIRLLRVIAERAENPSVEDSVDLFFKFLATTTKTFSPLRLVEAKKRLFDVIADIEVKNIRDEYSGPSGNSPVINK